MSTKGKEHPIVLGLAKASIGQLIHVEVAGGEVVERRLVRVVDDWVLAICKDEEYQAAQREGREPLCVGFPLDSMPAYHLISSEPLTEAQIAEGQRLWAEHQRTCAKGDSRE